MDSESSTILDSVLQDRSSEPCRVPLEYLRKITYNFSDEQLLGEGGFGKVYKGVLQNEKMIAVKKLQQLKPGVQDRQFKNEVYHLMKVKHPNIARLVGYCYETWNECLECNGKHIFAEIQQRLICLEYMPNGSLDRHLSDESSGLDWHARYRIIKGICCGLHYLHEECKYQFNASIVHLDLKPANILLDESMVPKVADFGLSRLFEDKKTQTCVSTVAGSLGYMAPEYIIGRIITNKADIYSMGVIIIEIITGSKIDPFTAAPFQDFLECVLKNWENRLEGAPSETDCKQIKCCLEIGLRCIKIDRDDRPTARDIIEILNRWESTNCYVNNEENLPSDQKASNLELGPPIAPKLMDSNGATRPVTIPDEFRCPICRELMKDPVTVATGQTYERACIEKWLEEGNLTCPTTGQRMTNTTVTPNSVLKSTIVQWCKASRIERRPKTTKSGPNKIERADIDALLSQLCSRDPEKRSAAAELRLLAKHNAKNRMYIAEAGGIPLLLSVVSSSDVRTQEHAVTTLLNLSIHEDNKARIISSGAVPIIVHVLENGSMEARENAAATLFSLSVIDEYKITIGQTRAIPALMDLLSDGSQRGKKDAAAALFNLCLYQGNKIQALRAGIAPLTMWLVANPTGAPMDEAMAILSILSNHPEGKEAEPVPVLVEMIRSGTLINREKAAAVMLHLFSGKQQHVHLTRAKECGIMGPLRELALNGTERGKRKAVQLIERMSRFLIQQEGNEYQQQAFPQPPEH